MTAPARAPGEERAAARSQAERIADAALSCPDVPSLTAGPMARIVTYRAGLPFTGVAVHPDRVEVGIVARASRPFPETAEDVRRLVRPVVGDLPIDVLVGDME
ncbi:hypothetical protein AGRA3207_002573 [Actinomadura graeca]|uniref:Asp23/Gls24 family envelope stress response protein n=1 Tax=Actinomadura graeca TaxID=2750812 RepID=A0ABX8QU19_9ACTN|nr:hypothetical protein [Actinomadura graeca]QXJ21694.1 hypothetical protein AGRA3207_002573 [Actinomadura graeca]